MPRCVEFAAVDTALIALPVTAQGPGDGAEPAKEHCTRCRDISTEGEMRTMPPKFASIAVFRDPKQIRMRIMFPTIHSIKPALSRMLSNAEVDDLVAYAVGLE
mgnify:CR=1 FL=1